MVAIDLARCHLYNPVAPLTMRLAVPSKLCAFVWRNLSANDAAGFGLKKSCHYLVVRALPGRVQCTSTSNASSTPDQREHLGEFCSVVSEAKTSRIDSRHKLTTFTSQVFPKVWGLHDMLQPGIHAETTQDRPAYISGRFRACRDFQELKQNLKPGCSTWR